MSQTKLEALAITAAMAPSRKHYKAEDIAAHAELTAGSWKRPIFANPDLEPGCFVPGRSYRCQVRPRSVLRPRCSFRFPTRKRTTSASGGTRHRVRIWYLVPPATTP